MNKAFSFSTTQAASIAMIDGVARRLGPELCSRVAFLGGASLALFLTDAAVSEVRSTNDVDVIVELLSYSNYTAFAEQLRNRGFREDPSEGAPICRWLVDDFVVDVMPTHEGSLGVTNRWYQGALTTAQAITLPNPDRSPDNREASLWPTQILLIHPVYFLATKLEAYNNRGNNDLFASHDMEDIVTLLDGRPEVGEEIERDAQAEVRTFICDCFQTLLRHPVS